MSVALEIAHQSQHRDAATKPKLVQDISPVCLNLGLAGIRVGIPWQLNDIKTMHGANVLKSAGATLVRNIVTTGADEYENLTVEEKQIVLDTDMKLAINKYLSSLRSNPNNITDLQDLIDFTKACPKEEYPTRNVAGKNGLVNVAPGIPFSVYVFGGSGRDEDVLRVGDLIERVMRVRERLEPYLEPRTEIGNVLSAERVEV
ncbi:hypothetical protein BKA63DRAFT_559322 [Paraphoma chrysanthemicola]|nr:hypothetical protein BKA63DRAFT_559322 [Paraphoma chrysanthemicola]